MLRFKQNEKQEIYQDETLRSQQKKEITALKSLTFWSYLFQHIYPRGRKKENPTIVFLSSSTSEKKKFYISCYTLSSSKKNI